MIFKCYWCNKHIKSLHDYNERSYCGFCDQLDLLCHDCQQNLRISQITEKHGEERHASVNII